VGKDYALQECLDLVNGHGLHTSLMWRAMQLLYFVALLKKSLQCGAPCLKVHPSQQNAATGCQVIEPSTDMQTNAGAG
jgi:hypothetical protein